MKPDDKEANRWVIKAKQGNRKAFDRLVNLYQTPILALTYHVLGDYDEAKDAAQEAFIRAFENISRFKQDSRFSTWLYRIAVNVALDETRRKKRRKTDPLSATKLLKSDAHTETPAQEYEQRQENKEQHKRIFKAMQHLSKQQRTATVLKYFHDKSYKDIADILNCSQATARTHVFRALQHMKDYFEGSST
ncbi:MAG: RNA polymerase sigma factor [candidate division KSB1 bacterium]|nr:RNA polymerase sigma factor [candidate division KSB1 bacterium]